MSLHSRDRGKDNILSREYNDSNHQRSKSYNDSDQHGRHDRRYGTNPKKEKSPRRDGEGRRDRREYSEDRRSYRREYDDRKWRGDRELDHRDRDRDRNRDYEARSDRRRRENSTELGTRSRRSASPRRRSPSPSHSKSPVDKPKPNFNPSGLLAAATNTVEAADGTSTILKYNEPPEARKPTFGWRLYVFKGDKQSGN